MTTLYILLALVVVALVVLVVVFYIRKKKAKAAAAQAGGRAEPAADEITQLVRAAESKLSAARLGGGGNIGSLPVYVLMGEPASAKTSVMLHSGLDPELLAGQVYRDAEVAPTPVANLWFSRRSVFAEAGGKLLAGPGPWSRFVRGLRPRSSVLAKGGQAPRAALVCLDCETFTRAGAQEAVANAARTLRSRLGEMSQALGIDLPVYALFTKMDRLPFFTEYVRNLSDEEANQTLGATLALLAGRGEGVYAEQETARLSAAFESLFRSLADARPRFLARETDPAKLPATYEFPREFRKIRPAAVQFLVDLCRPSQLSVGPVLRGFYFTGVRPVIINEAAPVAAAPPPQQGGYESVAGATGIFTAGGRAQAAPAAAQRVGVSRKVPQWLFLSHFFGDILLADRAAMGASGASVKTSFARRALLIAAASLCLLLSIGFTVSFFKNRGLERRLSAAAQSDAAAGAGLAPVESLRKLDNLRQSLATLIDYRRNGAPMSYRLGLYAGDRLYPEAWRIYFDRFRQLLLLPAQSGILQDLRGLPAASGPDYSPTYDALKAYLITTSNHEHSGRQFLTPVLMKWWATGASVDPERQQLARDQFDFYADALKDENPYPPDNDDAAIDKARRYLAGFGGEDRVYAFMLSEAGKTNPPINFNRQFAGSAQVVLEKDEVPGAFSKGGWAFMKNAIQHSDQYFNGEPWVLGGQAAPAVDQAALAGKLRARYNGEFIDHWRSYIKSASVVGYLNLPDASKKLALLSGNQCPLLELFWLASQNTAVDDPDVAGAFQPVHAVVPPGSTDQYVLPPNQGYITALLALQTSLDAIAGQPGPPNDAAAGTVSANATQAKLAVGGMAGGFHPDAQGHVDDEVKTLLLDPIIGAQTALNGVGPAELNAKGKAMCGQFRTVLDKFPFKPNAKVDASVADVNGLLRKPDGALWVFYDQNLQKKLVKQGSQFAAGPAGGINQAFLTFFNAAAEFSDAIYAGGSQDPHFTYLLRPEPSDGIQKVDLSIDGQSFGYSGAGAPKQFTWQAGGVHSVKAEYSQGGPDNAFFEGDGLWAIFHFFDDADHRTASGAGQSLEFVMTQRNQPLMSSGKPVVVRLGLDMAGAPAVFQPGFFNRFACVADVAR